MPPIVAISDYARLVILNEQQRPGSQWALTTPGMRDHRVTLAYREVRTAVGVSARNVIGEVAGEDSSVAREYIVVLGRLDHLGMEPPRATGYFQPPRTDSVYVGADAGGTSAALVLALADRLSRSPMRRSVLFVLTSGAEGARGAQAFVANLPVPADRIVAVISADRVGQPAAGTLDAYGLTSDGVAAEFRLRAVTETAPGWVCASDYAAVARGGLKGLLLTTGTRRMIEPLYDRAAAVDYAHFGRVVDAIEGLVRELGDGARSAVTVGSGPPRGCE
jgi:Zn-dependent M28 family amino/carboxypeptidase